MVKRHVAPGAAVPLHPEAAAFADQYGFAIDVLAAYRPSVQRAPWAPHYSGPGSS